MDAALERLKFDFLVHGNASGVDNQCADWADRRGIEHSGLLYSAKWNRYRGSAGPIRNRRMLFTERPSLLIAFPGLSGTADCCAAASELGIEIRKASEFALNV
jgi:hypothetical protein